MDVGVRWGVGPYMLVHVCVCAPRTWQVKWESTVNKAFKVKEEIQPLQNALADTIRKVRGADIYTHTHLHIHTTHTCDALQKGGVPSRLWFTPSPNTHAHVRT